MNTNFCFDIDFLCIFFSFYLSEAEAENANWPHITYLC